jgi:hypothetical protein
LSFFDDLIRRDENELGFGIDESGNQPWTCHAIYFRAFTSNPTHNFLLREISSLLRMLNLFF